MVVTDEQVEKIRSIFDQEYRVWRIAQKNDDHWIVDDSGRDSLFAEKPRSYFNMHQFPTELAAKNFVIDTALKLALETAL
jgi:hypothetical protein